MDRIIMKKYFNDLTFTYLLARFYEDNVSMERYG